MAIHYKGPWRGGSGIQDSKLQTGQGFKIQISNRPGFKIPRKMAGIQDSDLVFKSPIITSLAGYPIQILHSSLVVSKCYLFIGKSFPYISWLSLHGLHEELTFPWGMVATLTVSSLIKYSSYGFVSVLDNQRLFLYCFCNWYAIDTSQKDCYIYTVHRFQSSISVKTDRQQNGSES